MITFKHKGSFSKTENYLKKAQNPEFKSIITKYAIQGVMALETATPQDTGITSFSWDYEVEISKKGFRIHWTNDNLSEGIPVVILLQYGHGTRGGTFVQGQDFINPAIRPIFDAISDNLWKEVTSL